MNSILILLNNSKKEYHSNNISNLFAKRILKIKNKKNKNINKLIHNYSSSFIKYKNIKSKLPSNSKFFDNKNNKSNNNSTSSHHIKGTKNSKNFEGFNHTLKQKTPKIKHKINILNKNNIKKQLKKELSFFKKIPFKQLLTTSHDKKNNNSLGNKNICFTKYKTKVKLKNYFLKNNLLLKGGNSFYLKNNGNIKNSENLNKYSSFYKKINKKQNITINRFLNNKNNKKYEIKLNDVVNKIKNNKNIGNISYEKYSEIRNIIKLKKSGIFQRKLINLNNPKKVKNGSIKHRDKSGILLKKELTNKIKKVYMKTNQGTLNNKKNNSSSHENIFLNNNYNNYINFNYIDKNFNINSINIGNRQQSVKPYKKNSSQKIIYKKINQNQNYISNRRDNNDLLDYLQLKFKGNNNISTLQSREEISLSDLKKLNSYFNLIPNNSSFNSISPDYKIKNIFDNKNRPYKNNVSIKKHLLNKDIKKDSKKTKDNEIKKSKEKQEQKETKKTPQKNQVSINNKTNSDINDINTISNISINISNISLSTIKDKSYYISERENLCQYIKKYYKEKGHYPKSSLNFYKYGRILGKGAFGKVNLALHIASGRLVAIKSFNKNKLKTEYSMKKIMNEIEVLKLLKKNIFCTKIFDTFQTESHILIVMEFICADLLNYIRKREKLNEKISKNIFKQIILGLKYMQKKKIVHRDIKLDNILLNLTNTIKICDFGVSKILSSPDEVMHDHCGTPAYIAPEVFENIGYCGYACDIWSLGVTLYYMLGGEQPFKGKTLEELKKNIFLKKYDKINFISKEANDLIDKMLTVNPEERITLEEILKHQWIKDVDVKNRNKIKFFSKNEKYLLKKYNVSYLKNNTQDLIENFEQGNLITNDNEDEKRGNTKSIILAPYNTFIHFFNESNSDSNIINDEIKIENNICKFKGEAQISNIQYQMSNNDEFDNGIIKTMSSCTISSFSSFSHNFNDDININLKKDNYKKKNNNLSLDDKNKETNFCEDIIQEIEDKVGYDKNYQIQCLRNDEVNYATATYFLLLEDRQNNSII